MDLDRHLVPLTAAVEVHGSDGEAQELLALAMRGRGGVPDRRQVLGERIEGRTLLAAQGHARRSLVLGDGLLQAGDLLQRRLPASF